MRENPFFCFVLVYSHLHFLWSLYFSSRLFSPSALSPFSLLRFHIHVNMVGPYVSLVRWTEERSVNSYPPVTPSALPFADQSRSSSSACRRPLLILMYIHWSDDCSSILQLYSNWKERVGGWSQPRNLEQHAVLTYFSDPIYSLVHAPFLYLGFSRSINEMHVCPSQSPLPLFMHCLQGTLLWRFISKSSCCH